MLKINIKDKKESILKLRKKDFLSLEFPFDFLIDSYCLFHQIPFGYDNCIRVHLY